VYFSPVHDARLPDVDGVYLGGGYPELHAAALAGNQGMRAALHDLAAKGRPIYAECGGLMYLCEAIVTIDGARHPMLGLVAGTAEVQRTLQAIGYVEIETSAPSLLGPSGTRARGHQFRYSRLMGASSSELYALRTPSSDNTIVGYEGYGRRSVLGSYVHLCFASAPAIAESIVRACVQSSS
jgi:cobyrinic acid a,c-diamide synthase